jgi:tetratricopeptide (TPR) repeat protein
MKSLIAVYLLLGNFILAHSQTKAIDSLSKVLHQSKTDADKARLMNQLANEYKAIDPKPMQTYAGKALQLSRNIGLRAEEGNALLNLGNSAIILGDYPEALKYFASAQGIFESQLQRDTKDMEVKKGLAKAYGSIGIVFAEQSNYSKALQYHFKSVGIYEEVNDLKKSAQVYNNIGVAYKSLSDDTKALQYFLKAQKIQVQVNDPHIGITLTNIANCYLKQKDTGKALEFYNKSKEYLDKNPDSRALGEWYNNMGLLYQTTHNLQMAVDSWNNAIKTFQSIDDKFGVANTHIYLGQLFLNEGNTNGAMQNAEKALNLAKELHVPEQIVVAEKLLSDIYSQRHDIEKAFLHYQLYSVAKDSLNNVENIRKGVESAMAFEFEKREVLQRKELEKKEIMLQQQSKQNRIQLIFTIVLLLMLAGIGFLFYNRSQLKKTLTLQKELAEYEQKALHLQMNPHFVFNCLGSISSFIVKNGKDSAIKYLAKFSKLMRLTLEYSKQPLIPIDKEIQSLQNYLELEQLRFNHKFDFEIIKDKAIEDDMALPPLLLQPFVENAIIHGIIPSKKSGEIRIEFRLVGDNFLCAITDNGIGYDRSRAIKQNSASVHQSMALDITKKRLEMIAASTAKQAKVYIEETHSENNKTTGTKVILNLPVQYIK